MAPTSGNGQAGVVPKGAPDTGVAPAGGHGGIAGTVTGTALGVVLLGGMGAVAVSRRSKAKARG
ncbi:hypothetical protein ACWGCW_21765 [Streptomyces sp. NPDC054933]